MARQSSPAAAGLHPACPGDTHYELFTPLFNQVTFRLKSATPHGKPLDRCWLDYREIMAGGKLELVLGPQPNKGWGLAESSSNNPK